MKYYKIIQGGLVIGAGCTFLKWHPAKHRFFYCDADEAERVQDAITERVYHADWLLGSPPDAGPADEATVEMISAAEYDEIIALLADGETIQEPEEPEIEPVPEPEPEPEPEKPMTVQEMRSKIIEQQEEIESLQAQIDLLISGEVE